MVTNLEGIPYPAESVNETTGPARKLPLPEAPRGAHAWPSPTGAVAARARMWLTPLTASEPEWCEPVKGSLTFLRDPPSSAPRNPAEEGGTVSFLGQPVKHPRATGDRGRTAPACG